MAKSTGSYSKPNAFGLKKRGSESGRPVRPVICIETGQVFDSVKDAAAAIGVKRPSYFSVAIKEHYDLGGFHWRYADSGDQESTPPGQCQPKPVVCYETSEVFESLTAAGRSVGVSASTVSSAIHRGGTAGGYHWYFKGQEKPSAENLKYPPRSQARAVVCWETGEVFPSAKDAARNAGVEETDRVTTAIARRATAGGFHWYWADEPKPDASELTKPSTAGQRPVVCYETGEVFENYITAAHAVGLKKTFSINSAIRNKKRAGGYHWYYQDQPKPEPSELKSAACRPVVCWETGEVFESSYAAIAAVGLKNPSSIGAAIKRKGVAGSYHWYYQDQPKPDASELLPSSQGNHRVQDSTAKKPRAVVCWETGDVYASAREAAAAVGLSASVHIYRAIKSRDKAGGYHWYYADEDKPTAADLKPSKQTKTRPVLCRETGEVFESARAAAAAMNLRGEAPIYNAIRNNTMSAGKHWKWADK